MNISRRHLYSNFAHSFDFKSLTKFAKSINLWWMVSQWCELLCNLSIYTLKSDQWIPTWWAKFEFECLKLSYIYFNSKFKVTCMPIHQNSFRRKKTSKISNIIFCIFFRIKIPLKLPPWYFEIYFSSWNYQIRFKIVHFSPQNAKFDVL